MNGQSGNPRPLVLFVDDEPNILRALRREMMGQAFEVLTAGGGEEALALLERQNVELVVSDMRMPRMDGITLLRAVRERFPQVGRIILSGFVEKEVVVQAVLRGDASAYMAKPWDREMLASTLEHLLRVRQRLRPAIIQEALQESGGIPIMPRVYQAFLDAIRRDRPVRELADILDRDVILTANILKMSNGIFWGRREITTVERALIQLGVGTIRDMVLLFSLSKACSLSPLQQELIQQVCHHSLNVQILFARLYQTIHQEMLPEEWSSAALTHDLGKILQVVSLPKETMKLFSGLREGVVSSYRAGEEGLGVIHPHTEMGASLLILWNLPHANVTAALFHHQPDEAPPDAREIMSLLALANDWAQALEWGRDTGACKRAWQEMGGQKTDELEALLGTKEQP